MEQHRNVDTLLWASAGRTECGLVRTLNEDALLVSPDSNLWCVADGMGGHDSGEVASTLITRILSLPIETTLMAAAVEEIDRRLQTVNKILLERGAAEDKVMGSTVVVATAKKNMLAVLWAGDSRAYLIRRGKWHPLTRDHSKLQSAIDRGESLETIQSISSNVLNRAVGAVPDLMVDVELIQAEPEDWVVLCTDGLEKHMHVSELACIEPLGSPSDFVNMLTETILQRGAIDNVSIVAAHALRPST